MDKNRFETQKHVVNLDTKKHPIQNYFTVEDLKWLIEQAEKVEELSKFKKDAETLFQRQKLGFANLAEKIERYEKALNDIVKELNRYCSEGWTTKALEIANKSLEG
jgi:hypothetical protein